MLRTLFLPLLAACLVPRAVLGAPTDLPAEPPGAGDAPARAEGRVDAGAVRVEILGKPVRVGERIELPEGFLRVEEEGTEDRQVGSFTVVPAETLRPTAVALADSHRAATDQAHPAPEAVAPPEAPVSPACRRERAAYLRELWKVSGIEVDDPVAVLEGLEAGAQGPASGFYWFALATDPFRPLAWSSDLRARADALARCARRD